MVSNLRGRLEEVGMLSLEERRMRGDMIATYKIMSCKDKVDPWLLFEREGEGQRPRTRGDAKVHSIRHVGARFRPGKRGGFWELSTPASSSLNLPAGVDNS